MPHLSFAKYLQSGMCELLSSSTGKTILQCHDHIFEYFSLLENVEVQVDYSSFPNS